MAYRQINDDFDFHHTPEEIEGLFADGEATVLPPSERALRIKAASDGKTATITSASAKPAGRVVETVNEFAAAMLALPDDAKVRKKVMSNAARRVRLRKDISPTDKMVFASLAWDASGEHLHSFSLMEAVAYDLGFKQARTVSDAIDRLAAIGLVYKTTDKGRVYTVPALLPCDIDGVLAADITNTKKAIHRSGRCHKNTPAVIARALMAKAARNNKTPPSDPPTPPASHAGVNPFPPRHTQGIDQVGQDQCGYKKTAKGISDEIRVAEDVLSHKGSDGQDEQQPTGSPSTSSRQTPSTPSAGALTAATEWTRDLARQAHAQSSTLTAAELRANFDVYRCRIGATWISYLSGLARLDETRRDFVRAELGSDGAVSAFIRWDRSINGNSKQTPKERIAKFRLSAAGRPYEAGVRECRAQIKRAKLRGGDHGFTVGSKTISFKHHGKHYEVPQTGPQGLFSAIGTGSADDMLSAAWDVLRLWGMEGKGPTGDLTLELAQQARKLIEDGRTAQMF